MLNFDDNDLVFVLNHYRPGLFDTKAAIRNVCGSVRQEEKRPRRLRAVLATVLSTAAVAFAGYRIATGGKDVISQESISAKEQAVDTEEEEWRFVYSDTPLEEVLAELSKHYGCHLETDSEGRRLTASFHDDGIEVIVPLIEAALGIEIEVKE